MISLVAALGILAVGLVSEDQHRANDLRRRTRARGGDIDSDSDSDSSIEIITDVDPDVNMIEAGSMIPRGSRIHESHNVADRNVVRDMNGNFFALMDLNLKDDSLIKFTPSRDWSGYIRVDDSSIAGAGKGVFATKTIRKKQYIGDYGTGGIVLTTAEYAARKHDGTDTHILGIHDIMVDGLGVDGHIMSKINTTKNETYHNVSFTEHGTVVALTAIDEGDELIVGYGEDYYLDDAFDGVPS